MKKLIKILHIDPSWQVIYILIRDGALIKSNIPLEKALVMLKNEKFDLIISEPQKMAILDHQTADEKEVPDGLPLWKNNHRASEKIMPFQTGR